MKILGQHEKLQNELQGLLNWVSDTSRLLDGLEPCATTSANHLNSCLQSYKVVPVAPPAQPSVVTLHIPIAMTA